MFKVLYLAALLAPLATPAAARPYPPTTRIVPYGDLDLGNPEGARTLERRIARAARALCTASVVYPGMYYQERKCRDATIAGTAPQVMAALAGARGGQVASGAMDITPMTSF